MLTRRLLLRLWMGTAEGPTGEGSFRPCRCDGLVLASRQKACWQVPEIYEPVVAAAGRVIFAANRELSLREHRLCDFVEAVFRSYLTLDLHR